MEASPNSPAPKPMAGRSQAIERLYRRLVREVPSALADWDERVGNWCDEYLLRWPDGQLSEIVLEPAVFIFDHMCERVCLAYAISVIQLMKRDASRMRGFPNVNKTVQRVLGDKAFPADRGHFLGHASGGELDINLFPQRRELNRGWSDEGKRFRKMEVFAAEHPGTFFFHRPIYNDETWVPARLEYGLLKHDHTWWIETFPNRPPGE